MNNSLKKSFNDAMKTVINKCRSEAGIVNELIRDDVFHILEHYCYIVYYPLDKEDINGFHVTRTVNGEKKHFVYINTKNTTERQIFTAAHELGHILNVYSKVKNIFNDIDSYVEKISEKTPEEYVVDQFAAQLLMPESLFRDEMNKLLKKMNYNGSTLSKLNLLRLIISLMDTFFVGYKTTTLRLVEIGKMNLDVYKIMLECENDDDFKRIIKEFNRLNYRAENKNMTQLSELIQAAESIDAPVEKTIESLKEAFDVSTSKAIDCKKEVIF